MNRQKPPAGRRFYAIYENEDGTANVYLHPEVLPAKAEDENSGYNTRILAVLHVEPFDGLEEDIRARYEAWCESAEVIYL